MMDEIAAAQSAAELVWLRAEVARRFASDPRRVALERLVDEMMLLVVPGRAPPPLDPAGRQPRPDSA